MGKRFDKMSPREKFVRLMIRGWKENKKKYVSGTFGGPNVGFCAMGVVADELGCPPADLRSKLGWFPYGIPEISDAAGSKAAAIRNVKKYLLG